MRTFARLQRQSKLAQLPPTPALSSLIRPLIPGLPPPFQSMSINRQSQPEDTAHFGHSLAHISIFPPTKSPSGTTSGQTYSREAFQSLSSEEGQSQEQYPSTMQHVAQAGMQTPLGPLPYAQRIQQSFGRHDISRIPSHLGHKATASAQALSASAYTTNGHIIFADEPDLRTVAHEATHVMQQRAGIQLTSGIGKVGDSYEQHADAVAAKVLSGQSAEALLDRFSNRQGKTQHARSLSEAATIPDTQHSSQQTTPGIQRMLKKPDGTPLKNFKYYQKQYAFYPSIIDEMEKGEDVIVVSKQHFTQLIEERLKHAAESDEEEESSQGIKMMEESSEEEEVSGEEEENSQGMQPISGIERGQRWLWVAATGINVLDTQTNTSINVSAHPLHSNNPAPYKQVFWGSYTLVTRSKQPIFSKVVGEWKPKDKAHTEPQYFAWVQEQLKTELPNYSDLVAIILEVNQTNTPCSGKDCRKAILDEWLSIVPNVLCIVRMSAYQMYETQPPKVPLSTMKAKEMAKKGTQTPTISTSTVVHKAPNTYSGSVFQ